MNEGCFEILDARFASQVVASGDGVHCYDPDGTLIGKIMVPEVVANVRFGGRKRNYLYMCGTTSLYGIRLPVRGARTF